MHSEVVTLLRRRLFPVDGTAGHGGFFESMGYGYGVFATSARGQAAHFEITNTASTAPALE